MKYFYSTILLCLCLLSIDTRAKTILKSDSLVFTLTEAESSFSVCSPRTVKLNIAVQGQVSANEQYNLYIMARDNADFNKLVLEKIESNGVYEVIFPAEMPYSEYGFQVREVSRFAINGFADKNTNLGDSEILSYYRKGVPHINMGNVIQTVSGVSTIGQYKIDVIDQNGGSDYTVEFDQGILSTGGTPSVTNSEGNAEFTFKQNKYFVVNFNGHGGVRTYKPIKAYNECGVGIVEGVKIVRIVLGGWYGYYSATAHGIKRECFPKIDSIMVSANFLTADSLIAKGNLSYMWVEGDSINVKNLNVTDVKILEKRLPEPTEVWQMPDIGYFKAMFYFERPEDFNYSKQYYINVNNLRYYYDNGGSTGFSSKYPGLANYSKPKPTATLSGTFAQAIGAETKATISINEENPWLLKVVDQEGGIAFNNFPDISIDSLSKLDINQFSPITTKDYEISLIANQDNVYHIDQAYSETCGLAQTEGQLTVTLVLGQEDLDASINIFPNPSASLITVDLSSLNSPATLSIIDQRGKSLQTIKDITEKSKTIDVSSYTSGTYMLNIRTKEGSKSFRVVKQ